MINITGRELFVDDLLIDSMSREMRFKQYRPRPENVVLADDKPWESTMAYFSVLQDREVMRMYYRGFHHGRGEQGMGEPVCYAESRDGIHWEKPDLQLFGYHEQESTNIVFGGNYDTMRPINGDAGYDLRWRGEMTPFIDTQAAPEQRYKTLLRGARGYHQIADRRTDYGMYPAASADALNWHVLTDKPVITRGQFDSQNVVIYDHSHSRYAAFTRDSHGMGTMDENENWSGPICRDVRVAFSDDFIHWSNPVYLDYEDGESFQMYTNAVICYERAPQFLLGFPTIYYPENSQTEPILMFSRDGGRKFRRMPLGLIPRDTPCERDGNRGNYMAHGLIQANDREIFCYATEGYMDGPERRLRRFVWRTDGFVSLGTESGGEMTTRLLTTEADRISVNFTGRIRIEQLGEDGRPLPGGIAELSGNEIEAPVPLANGGKAFRLRFQMWQAELFSIAFENK